MSAQTANGATADSSTRTPLDLEKTREKLEVALDSARSNAETTARDEPSVDVFVTEPRDILERATSAVAVLLDAEERNASFDDLRVAFEDLLTVIDEAADLLETVDPETLSDAVELKRVPTAVDAKSVPKSLTTGNFADAIEFEQLVALVDFGTLLRGVDLWSFYEEKSEMDEAVANAADNLESGSGRERDGQGPLRRRLQGVYKQTQETSDAVSTGSTSQNSSRNPLLHSTVPSKKRLDMRRSARLSTVPKQ